MVSKTVRSASLCQQGAEPGSIQATQSEAAEAEGAVVQVQTQSAQQQDDSGSITALHADGQRPPEVLLVGAAAKQELHQLQGPTTLTHLRQAQRATGEAHSGLG